MTDTQPSENQTKIRIKANAAGKPSLPKPIIIDGEPAAKAWAAVNDPNCIQQVSDDEARVRLSVTDRFTTFRLANKTWKIHDHAPAGVDVRHLVGILLVALDLANIEEVAKSRLASRVLTDDERKLFTGGAGRPEDQRTLEAYLAIEAKLKFLGAAQ